MLYARTRGIYYVQVIIGNNMYTALFLKALERVFNIRQK
jgi:hypothetical protein